MSYALNIRSMPYALCHTLCVICPLSQTLYVIRSILMSYALSYALCHMLYVNCSILRRCHLLYALYVNCFVARPTYYIHLESAETVSFRSKSFKSICATCDLVKFTAYTPLDHKPHSVYTVHDCLRLDIYTTKRLSRIRIRKNSSITPPMGRTTFPVLLRVYE